LVAIIVEVTILRISIGRMGFKTKSQASKNGFQTGLLEQANQDIENE